MPIDETPFKSLTERVLPKRRTAVALKDTNADDPSKLVEIMAAGRGALAERIIELAFAYNIPVREDSDLTELLAQFEIDTPIPTEAIMAVAEILSYVYKLNQQAEPLSGIFQGGE